MMERTEINYELNFERFTEGREGEGKDDDDETEGRGGGEQKEEKLV